MPFIKFLNIMKKNNEQSPFLFDKQNYVIMIIGLFMIGLGFALMAGGKSDDPNIFIPDEVYSFRRITLAPIVVLLGFLIEIYAIFHKSK
tara:strand:- start:399 stop:665 length:267 start_codon:yes stop_codon:yes gene_type:complete